MSGRLLPILARLLASFVVFLLLSEIWDIVVDAQPFAIDRQEVLAGIIVAVLIVIWRLRQDRRAKRGRVL